MPAMQLGEFPWSSVPQWTEGDHCATYGRCEHCTAREYGTDAGDKSLMPSALSIAASIYVTPVASSAQSAANTQSDAGAAQPGAGASPMAKLVASFHD